MYIEIDTDTMDQIPVIINAKKKTSNGASKFDQLLGPQPCDSFPGWRYMIIFQIKSDIFLLKNKTKIVLIFGLSVIKNRDLYQKNKIK